VEITAGF